MRRLGASGKHSGLGWAARRSAAARLRPCKDEPAARAPKAFFCRRARAGGRLTTAAARQNSLCDLRSRRSDNCRESEHDADACCAAMAQPPSSPSQALPQGVGDAGHRCARPRADFALLALACGKAQVREPCFVRRDSERARCGIPRAACEGQLADCGLRIADCRLPVAGCRLRKRSCTKMPSSQIPIQSSLSFLMLPERF